MTLIFLEKREADPNGKTVHTYFEIAGKFIKSNTFLSVTLKK
jgi:hypothetical protein